ncbi:iron-siderophore ABC transporter substrate-binding protein [Vibrio aestuarianus]|uniref:iron-siderophore ABC transporter substrate-binding protein n=1 Tax=Vibrio aestuarianus TaxID=28171 RepID=UPI003B97A627
MVKSYFLLLSLLLTTTVQAITVEHELGSTTFEHRPKTIATLDWALTETVLSLGVNPVGVADVKGYQTWVSEPRLSDSVADVGSRREPNLELLTQLKPDVILISQAMSHAYPQLNMIAPTLVYSIYSPKKTPLENAKAITKQLGELFNKSVQAEAVIAQTNAKLELNGQYIRQYKNSDRPLLFVRFLNEKTVRIHGNGSLSQDVLQQMGLVNSWRDTTNMWGFTTAGIEKLAEHQVARVLLFGPLQPEERSVLEQSALFQTMAFSRQGLVYELPPIWTFGGLISAQRLSDQITKLVAL